MIYIIKILKIQEYVKKKQVNKKCLELTNEFRKKNKLLELEWDDEIWRVAYVHSEK